MGANIEMAGDPSLDSAKDIEAGAERDGPGAVPQRTPQALGRVFIPFKEAA